jgi:hypothetical protein
MAIKHVLVSEHLHLLEYIFSILAILVRWWGKFRHKCAGISFRDVIHTRHDVA